MTLDFPNPSRSFDEARNAVRFIGHDGMFEVPFFIEAAALASARGKGGGLEAAEAASLAVAALCLRHRAKDLFARSAEQLHHNGQ